MVKLDNFYAIFKVEGHYRVRPSNTLFTIQTIVENNNGYQVPKLEIWQLDDKGFFKPEEMPGFVQFIHQKAFPTDQQLKSLQRAHEERDGARV